MIKITSVKTKLTLLNSLVIAIIILLFSLIIYSGFRYVLNNRVNVGLKNVAEAIAFKLNDTSVLTESFNEYIKSEFERSDIKPVFVNIYANEISNGSLQKLIFTSNEKFHFMIDDNYKKSYISNETYNGLSYRKYTLSLPSIVTTYKIIIASPIDSLKQNMRLLLFLLLFIDAILLALSFLIGYYITNATLRPIKFFNEKIANISSQKALVTRLDTTNNGDEIDSLAINLNGMLEKLEKSFSIISQFTSDVAHELKTPLTIINGEVELALKKQHEIVDYKKSLMSISLEIMSLNEIIESLLFLSKTEHNYETKFKNVSMDQIILESYEEAMKLAGEKKILLDVKQLDFAMVRGNVVLLKRMVFNLITNAVKYSSTNDKVDIWLKNQDDCVRLDICDSGQGISAEDLPYIFDRFYRASKSRSKKVKGSGLGLAITKRIVDIHFGEIFVESNLGDGTTFTVIMPKINKSGS